SQISLRITPPSSQQLIQYQILDELYDSLKNNAKNFLMSYENFTLVKTGPNQKIKIYQDDMYLCCGKYVHYTLFERTDNHKFRLQEKVKSYIITLKGDSCLSLKFLEDKLNIGNVHSIKEALKDSIVNIAEKQV
ncbi:hypothetical protein D6810_02110, partial [Candidatus Dojkabacteria bacterium]